MNRSWSRQRTYWTWTTTCLQIVLYARHSPRRYRWFAFAPKFNDFDEKASFFVALKVVHHFDRLTSTLSVKLVKMRMNSPGRLTGHFPEEFEIGAPATCMSLSARKYNTYTLLFIENSKALRSLTFCCDCACNHIDEELFSEMIAAQKSSGTSTTLKMHLPLPVLMLKESKLNMRRKGSIQCLQLEKMDDEMEYVHAFSVAN